MRTGAVFACGLVMLCGAYASQRGPDPTQPTIAWSDDEDGALASRLADLDPDTPTGYFELAEEVVSSFPGSAGYRLARELYALAYALDVQRSGGPTLARSAALGIAEITADASERRWLLTMAGALRADGRGDANAELLRERVQAAELLALHRAGEFRRVRPLLQRVDLELVLTDAGMEREDARVLAERVASDAENLVDEDRTRGRGRREEALSPHPRNGGNPGPSLGPDAFMRSLRAEALLTGAEPSSWGADLGVRRGAPARDLDPDELLSITGVDAARPVWRPGPNGWRDGAWVAR